MSESGTEGGTLLVLLVAVSLAGAALLGGCQGSRAAAAAGAIAEAKVAEPQKEGGWFSGAAADPVKDKAGIGLFYRLVRVPGEPLAVQLRFEGVTAGDATVQFRAIDGASLADGQPAQYHLPMNAASEVTVRVNAPPGHSYLVLEMRQNGGFTSRSVLLRMPKPT